MKTKTMYAVEYYNQLPDEESTTFEIFETCMEAIKFASKQEKVDYLFKANFYLGRIFIEDGSWNYDNNCIDWDSFEPFPKDAPNAQQTTQ